MSFDAKAFLPSLPELPGVYRMMGEGDFVLYVGKAKNLKKRVSSYFQKTLSSPRIGHMVSQIKTIETTVTRSEAEALLLENNLIKTLAPRYNILFRDDKSYPYILLTREKYPRLGFFRGKPDRRADYFGPFPSAGAVRESLQLLQKTFRLRTCENTVFENRSRPCLLYQIKRCSGPCVDRITPENYAEDVRHTNLFLQGKQGEVTEHLSQRMEAAATSLAFEVAAGYRDQIQALRKIQEKQYVSGHKAEDIDIVVATANTQGQVCVNLAMVRGGQHLGDRPLFSSGVTADLLPGEALAAFLPQHYAIHPLPQKLLLFPALPDPAEVGEWLSGIAGRVVPLLEPRLSTHKAWVHMALQNAELALLARSQQNRNATARLDALREALGLEESLARIECFDISHTQGEATVASCVVYQGQGMLSSDYRRFNIRDITPGDDYAAMTQAVSRRYSVFAENTEASHSLRMPDLILIDGGKGQVSVAAEVLAQLGLDIPVLGVAKGEGRKAGLETLIFPDHRPPLALPPSHLGLLLVMEIRDEAHRFALTGHQARRGKNRKQSRLEDIPGIGPSRRKALIGHFGGLSGIAQANVEQLASVPGIRVELAERIYAALH